MMGLMRKGRQIGVKIDSDSGIRAAYIKFNNVVQEITRVRSMRADMLDGGPEAYVENFLRITDPDPVLIMSFHRSPKKDEFLKDGRIEAVSYYWAPRISVSSLLLRMVATLKMAMKLIRFRPTRILCAYASFPLWICYLVSRIYSLPLVCSRHTRFQTEGDPFYRRLEFAIDRWVFRRVAGVLCHGPYLKQLMIDMKVPPSRVFEFNWAFKHMKAGRVADIAGADLMDSPGATALLFIGRIESYKGVFDLLESCADRMRRNRLIKLVYAGAGNDLLRLKKAIADRDLDKQAVCLGKVPHDALAGLISRSYLVITPTQSRFPEGRCMATMEGLIMGKPVIAPDFGPFPYLVKHERNGLMYKADSVEDLSRQISRALDDHDLYERMCAGATDTGARLREPPVSFLEAIKSAFGEVRGN
jgi:glycosyltransferase involved in cell wall biosynthesis